MTPRRKTSTPTPPVNPYEKVRVRDHKTGDHYTTTRHLAAVRGDEVIEGHPAVDMYGRYLPAKPRKTVIKKSETTPNPEGETSSANTEE